MSYGYASNSNLRGAQRGAALTTATSSFVGVVRVDGSSMLVDANGTISVDPTALNNLSSNTTSSIAYLSSVAATRAETSTFGIVRPDNTSIVVTSGIISIATSSNGFGVRTIQSTSAGVPTGGSSGDIVYQY
jgi:hypothetical protein